MRINGEWLRFEDGVVRPVIRGEILGDNGLWLAAEFWVDTGADRTVFSAPVLESLHLQPAATQESLSGVGGMTGAVVIETQVRFSREEGGGQVIFRGRYAAVTELEALEVSILGRDVTGLFALIVDRPGDVVCLIGQRHRYTIEYR
jgi:hypothetical protein